MHNAQGRRDPQNILSALNFNLPHIPNSVSKSEEAFDVTMIVRLAGKKRKQTRYTVDLTNLYKRINENNISDPMWKPAKAAIGNDTMWHVFLATDQDVSQSIPITYASGGAVYIHSKALCKKILMCFGREPHKVVEPGAPDTGLLLKFNARMINNNEDIHELQLVRMVQEFADEKLAPKIVNYPVNRR